MSESLCRQRFRQRIELLKAHLQLVDAALVNLREESEVSKSKLVHDMIKSGRKKYPHLNHPVSRTADLVNLSRARNVESALVDLYRYVTEYLQDVLREMYDHKPMLVVGKASGKLNVSFIDIVKLGNWDAISERVVDDVFRRLENERSTLKLIDKLLAGTGVEVDDGVKANALCILNMRHLIIHNRSLADSEYVDAHGESLRALLGEKKSIKPGEKLPRRSKVAQRAIQSADDLVRLIDEGLINEHLISPR